MNYHDIIIRPVLTEKTYDMIGSKIYTFIVDKKANRTDVKQAVEAVFEGVKVDKVNIVNKMGKIKRQGRYEGRRPATKKAYVTLKKDSKGIEFFDSMQ
ncbi:MAG: 50S ribosomal protein L23 [Clostridia bacterium]|jgi:large subunit ribosomal protein L23|nr:50S ribosomal protein L23 [Clostridia bacterium]MBR3487310.1 50S ribosomal protein L23 [Clostridia bacterium]MBR6428609.1 50S ribosomal protein L23 [Clostridia bacterium]